MADSYIRHIDRTADKTDIIEYLDYLADRLTYILENIDRENLTDKLNERIGG